MSDLSWKITVIAILYIVMLGLGTLVKPRKHRAAAQAGHLRRFDRRVPVAPGRPRGEAGGPALPGDAGAAATGEDEPEPKGRSVPWGFIVGTLFAIVAIALAIALDARLQVPAGK